MVNPLLLAWGTLFLTQLLHTSRSNLAVHVSGHGETVFSLSHARIHLYFPDWHSPECVIDSTDVADVNNCTPNIYS